MQKTGLLTVTVLFVLFSVQGCQFWSNNSGQVLQPVSPVSPIFQSPVATSIPTPMEEVATPAILTPVKGVVEENVVFEGTGGVELNGTLFGQGKTGLVISQAPGESQTAWSNQARTIAAQGFTVLTYDLREQENSSPAEAAAKNMEDLKAAVAFLNEKGLTDHILLGVGENGILAIKVAAETNAKGVVTFSTPLSSDAFAVTATDLKSISGPKLFIDTEQSPTQAAAVQMFEWSDSPKTWRFLPGAAQGAAMYNTDYSQNLTDFLAAFFLLRLKS